MSETYQSYEQKPAESNELSGGVDFQAIYHMLREKAWLIVACVLVTMLLGGAYIMRTPKIYAATTGVQVEQTQRNVVNIQDIRREDLNSLELLKTIEQNLGNTALLQRVIAKLKLTPELIGLKSRPSKPYSENEVIEALQERISVKLQRGTRLIGVTAENHSPELAQQISQTLVKEYIRSNVEERVETEAENDTK